MRLTSQHGIRSGRTADEWFAALDRQWIPARSSQWVAQVLGIYSEGLDHWIQISRADQPDCSLVLHVTSSTTVSAAIAALAAGPAPDVAGADVVDVKEAA